MAAGRKKRSYKRIALALSLCAILISVLLGTGASLAWFSDSTEGITNIFHIADFQLEVSYRLEDGSWKSIDQETKVFDEQALYEPGYVQVVYLKVENKGDVAFDFTTGVIVTGCTTATNYFGREFLLQDYLWFGLTDPMETEAAMNAAVSDREKAAALANTKLNNYTSEAARLEAGKTVYLALVVRMPEDVDNEANYRGQTTPKVELGIVVKADQIK